MSTHGIMEGLQMRGSNTYCEGRFQGQVDLSL